MRNAPLVLALGAISLLVAGFAVTASSDPATATHGGPDVIGVDMDTTGNTATSLGTIEPCVEVTAGTDVTFDLFVTNIPAPTGTGGGVIGWQVQFLYQDSTVPFQSENQNFLVYSGAG